MKLAHRAGIALAIAGSALTIAATAPHAFSPGYIASWSRGDATVMHNAMDKATRAYNKIMEGTWPE